MLKGRLNVTADPVGLLVEELQAESISPHLLRGVGGGWRERVGSGFARQRCRFVPLETVQDCLCWRGGVDFEGCNFKMIVFVMVVFISWPCVAREVVTFADRGAAHGVAEMCKHTKN